MSENEWVKLPIPNPTALPKGTRCRSLHGDVLRAEMEIRISPSDDSKYFGDWFAERTGATYRDEYFSRDGIRSVQLPAGYVFRGSEVVKTECGVTCGCSTECADDDLGDTPEHLRPLLRAARSRHPEAIISEAEGCGVLWVKGLRRGYLHPHTAAERLFDGGFGSSRDVGGCGREDLREAIEARRCYPTEDARRIGREEFGVVFDEAQAPQADDLNAAIHASFKTGTEGIPKPQVKVGDNVKVLGIKRKRACACGSTTNVNLRLGVCAACHLEKRKAEVRAEMDRPVPKKGEEGKAPKGWPEQFSSPTYED